MVGVYVPEEIVTEILLNLPITSLVRFTRVSKTWRDLIRNPDFADKHWNKSSHKNNTIFLKRHNGSCRLLTQNSDNHPDQVQARFVFSSPVLDFLPVKSQLLHLLNGRWNECGVLGFGFDTLSNDYKVIRLGRFERFDYAITSRRAEIYKLGTNCWTHLDLQKLKVIRSIGGNAAADAYFLGDFAAAGRLYLEDTLKGNLAPAGGVFLNGCCHWLGLKTNLIVTFDFRTEFFGLIKCPISRIRSVSPTATLSVLDDSVALITSSPGLIEVWVMKMILQEDEDGEGGSLFFLWCLKCSVRFGHEVYFGKILTCWNDDWLLLRSRCGRGIVCCFIGKDGYIKCKAEGFDIGWANALSAVLFQPTLVSLQETQRRVKK
ncbi:OLC1v1009840C1 [Oldenlandia corymbosa var. corymbosa]|uniref:OLC1v1009840C1 n=1 Tax=Oldenlandia corymbosa var. corymbosa TaxID=529605 RepID=A0AAV1DSA0_OLDCO|nr:OLC1v1009840C1 [Oldenlandia corymbosa var. corymbosa]